jgi:hypothetical protein
MEVTSMIQLPQAIAAVMTCTLISGAAGGIVGAAIGRMAPSFLQYIIRSQAGFGNYDLIEFGFGLGMVCGLLMGAGASVFLVCVLVLRDAWLARHGVVRSGAKPAADVLE